MQEIFVPTTYATINLNVRLLGEGSQSTGTGFPAVVVPSNCVVTGIGLGIATK
jgi:hypothetical protein